MADESIPLPQCQPLEGGLLVRAPAKINLDLRVGPRRADGFHGLDSVVAKVTLYDEVELRPLGAGDFTFACRGADCGSDEKNLALRAGRALAKHAGGEARGADIRLTKHIPPGKGLGGGSSDAAAVLVGLNKLWNLGMSCTELTPLAATLGSDVPLFLGGATTRMTGRGECIEPIAVGPFAAILCLSEAFCSTADVYRAFDAMTAPGKEIIRDLVLSRFAQEPPSQWEQWLRNDLAAPALRVCPPLRGIWDAFAAATGAPVCLTGSGSALFALYDDLAASTAAHARLPAELKCVCVVVGRNSW